MKVRNKKTGEIIILIDHIFDNYASLAEFNEEWEDYEEPKVPCFINWFGEVSELLGHISDREIEKLKEAGNYFETREDAEKAVEKLKAFKRLKDKGFRFIDHIDRDSGQGMTRYEWDGYVHGEDLDLLFSQEDD